VLSWFETRKKELANRPLIREQAFGEALDAPATALARTKKRRSDTIELHLGGR
jgi:hypothetical protein